MDGEVEVALKKNKRKLFLRVSNTLNWYYMAKRHFLPARMHFRLSYVPVSDRRCRRRRRRRRPQLRAEADVVGAGGQEWVAVVVVVIVAAAAGELVVRWTRCARPPGATYDIWYINVFITIYLSNKCCLA